MENSKNGKMAKMGNGLNRKIAQKEKNSLDGKIEQNWENSLDRK